MTSILKLFGRQVVKSDRVLVRSFYSEEYLRITAFKESRKINAQSINLSRASLNLWS